MIDRRARALAARSRRDISTINAQRLGQQNILGQQWGARMQSAVSGSVYTWHQTFVIEAHATRFRVLFLNNSTSNTMVITNAMVAVSNRFGSTDTERRTPTGNWRALTFSGAQSGTVPIAANQFIPARLWSDWVYIKTVDRVDGGALPVVMVRVTTPASNISFANYSYTPWASASAFVDNRPIYVYRGVGNQGRPDNAAGFAGAAYQYPIVMGYEAQVAKPCFNFAYNGDSITEGAVNLASGNFGNGWAWQVTRALRAANPDIAIGYVNNGISSSDSSNFVTNVANFMASSAAFDAMVYSPFTPNDTGPTAAEINLMQQRFNSVIASISATGKPLIITTPVVNDNYNASQDGFRLGFRTTLLTYTDTLAGVVDWENAIADGATPNRFRSGMTTDLTHPNEAGYTAMVGPAQPVLQAMLDRVFR